MAGCGKKMAKGGMMKEEKMMKREGRGMAKASMQKKVKKMQEGGMATGNTQAEIEKLNQRIDMLRRQAAAQAQAVPQRSRLGGAPGAMQALGGPQGGASFGGMKKGGKVKKMKAGGKVRGDGICSKGKTKGRMI